MWTGVVDIGAEGEDKVISSHSFLVASNYLPLLSKTLVMLLFFYSMFFNNTFNTDDKIKHMYTN